METYKDTMQGKLKQDANLGDMCFFEKWGNNCLSHIAFETLDKFRAANKAMPKPWDLTDATAFTELAKVVAKDYDLDTTPADWTKESRELNFFYAFAFQAQGVFNPLCAFYGGFVA